MLNVGIIGIGNTGNQVAALAHERLSVPVIAINSSEKDLETIPIDIPKKLIKSATGTSHGAGKDRKLAKTYLRDSIKELLGDTELVSLLSEKNLDVVFVVSSTGGGTGSGTAPMMANIIAEAMGSRPEYTPMPMPPNDACVMPPLINTRRRETIYVPTMAQSMLASRLPAKAFWKN